MVLTDLPTSLTNILLAAKSSGNALLAGWLAARSVEFD